MIQKFKMDQFGVGLAGKLDKFKTVILDLKPDLVQMPLHIYLPSEEACEEVTKKGVKLIGKLVLRKDVRDVPAEMFRQLFTRFKDYIAIWDFGGEPETSSTQPGCRFEGNPKEFTEQVRAFYEIGKSVNSENIIGGCGWITSTFNGYFGNGDRSAFFKECLDLNIANYLDFISLNFYSYGYGGTKNIYVGMGKVNELLAWYRVEKPIVVSEFGVPCSGDPTFLHIIQTPERQAVSLVEQQILFASVGIDYAIWWSLWYDGWGLVDNDGRPRPSFKAFQTMCKVLKGAEYKVQYKAFPSRTVRERWLTDKCQWHLFTNEDKDIHVIWLSGGAELEREFSFKDVEVYDLYGNAISPSNAIRITASPIYIVSRHGEIRNDNFMLV